MTEAHVWTVDIAFTEDEDHTPGGHAPPCRGPAVSRLGSCPPQPDRPGPTEEIGEEIDRGRAGPLREPRCPAAGGGRARHRGLRGPPRSRPRLKCDLHEGSSPMGNRTKFVAATATAGVVGLAALRKRRHPRASSTPRRRHRREDHALGCRESPSPSPRRSPTKPTRPAITTCLVSRTSHRHRGCAAGRGPSAITAWYIRAGADAKQ